MSDIFSNYPVDLGLKSGDLNVALVVAFPSRSFPMSSTSEDVGAGSLFSFKCLDAFGIRKISCIAGVKQLLKIWWMLLIILNISFFTYQYFCKFIKTMEPCMNLDVFQIQYNI